MSEEPVKSVTETFEKLMEMRDQMLAEWDWKKMRRRHEQFRWLQSLIAEEQNTLRLLQQAYRMELRNAKEPFLKEYGEILFRIYPQERAFNTAKYATLELLVALNNNILLEAIDGEDDEEAVADPQGSTSGGDG